MLNLSIDKMILIKTAVYILAVKLLLYSVQYVTDESIWNWSRGILLFIFGVGSLVQITKLIRLGIAKVTSRKVLKFLSFIVWLPIFVVAMLILIFTSTCDYRGRVTTRTADISETIIRDTRVYVTFLGNMGAFGDDGQGVFQERHILGSFYQVKQLCRVYEWEKIEYSVIDDYVIKCNENGQERQVKLPF